MTVARATALGPCPHCAHEHTETQLKCPETDMPLPLEGRLLEGKFRLERPIGSGGMAAVWLATNIRVDRKVAIKLIRPEVLKSQDMVARFRSEARAAGRIGHPNICDILDYGVGPVGPYIVMEYLRGRSLAQIIKEDGPLDPSTAVMIVRAALQGLAAAHERGIIHRDLKPENVFLHQGERNRRIVKLMDFGVAKFTDGSSEVETEHGALLGTPEYMAPEQFKGAIHADERTDIWAIGAILYRALTGKNAFGGPTVAATLLMVSTDDPTPVRERAPHVPPGLETVVLRCLSKAPENRFQSVAELDQALAPFDLDEVNSGAWPAAKPVSLPLPEIPPPDFDGAPSPGVPEADTPMGTTSPWGDEPRRSRITAVMPVVFLLLAVGLGWWVIQQLNDRPAVDTSSNVAAATDAATAAAADDEPDETTTGPLALAGSEGTAAPLPTTAATGGSIEAAPTTTGLSVRPSLRSGAAGEDTGATSAAATPAGATSTTGEAATTGGPNPDGAIRSGEFITVARVPPRSDHSDARRYCEGLAAISHLGASDWSLANPTVAQSFGAVPGITPGRYWTSARWRGRVRVVSLPSGRMSSAKATRRNLRPLCVATSP